MRRSLVCGALCCTLVVATLLLTGCTQTSSPSASTPVPTAAPVATTAAAVMTTPSATMTTTPVPTATSVPTIFVNSSYNGQIVTIPASNQVLVTLAENPTTGYQWNATVSKGLMVVSDSYVAPTTTLVGAGGYHQWLLAPGGPGTYTFKAVYMRSWEGPSSAANTFSLVIQATPQ